MTAKKNLQVLVAQRNKKVTIGHNLAVNVGNSLTDDMVEPIAAVLPGKDFDMHPVILSTKTEIVQLVKSEKFSAPSAKRLRAAAKEGPAVFKKLELKPMENINGQPNPKYDANIEDDQAIFVTNIQFIPPSFTSELYAKVDPEANEHDAATVTSIIYKSAENQAAVDASDLDLAAYPTVFDDVLTDQVLAFLWIVGDKEDQPPVWKPAGPTATKSIKADAFSLFEIHIKSTKKSFADLSEEDSYDDDEEERPAKRQSTNHLSSDDIIQIIKATAVTTSNSSTTPNKNYDKLPEPIKDILCRLNTPPGHALSTVPTEAARSFFNSSLVNAGTIYLHNLLTCKDLQGKLSNGDCSFLKSSGFIWSEPSTPISLTVFGIQLTPSNDTNKQLALSIRAETTSRLEDSDVNFLLESPRQLPVNYYEYKDLLIAYEALWSCFTCAECAITKTVSKFIKHSKEHAQLYQSIFHDSPMEMTKMLYSLDNQVQLYLQQFQRYNWEQVNHLNFMATLNRTLNNFTARQLNIILSSGLVKMTSKKSDEKSKDNQASTSSKKDSAKAKKKDSGFSVSNSKQIADWIIPSSKKFGLIFDRSKMAKLRNENKFPSNGTNQICLKFHAIGECPRENCSNDHTPSKDLPSDVQKAAHEFFKDAYA
jgi:hypothetical protein